MRHTTEVQAVADGEVDPIQTIRTAGCGIGFRSRSRLTNGMAGLVLSESDGVPVSESEGRKGSWPERSVSFPSMPNFSCWERGNVLANKRALLEDWGACLFVSALTDDRVFDIQAWRI